MPTKLKDLSQNMTVETFTSTYVLPSLAALTATELESDAGFLAFLAALNTLTNYYLKSETLTETEINSLVDGVQTSLDNYIASNDEALSLLDTIVNNYIAANNTALSGVNTDLQGYKTSNNAAVALKSPIANPSFTGVPLAPTAIDATANTQIATTAFVHSLLTNLLNSAPANFDTLGEIATALANDESALAALITTVSGKLAKASNLLDLPNPATARTNLGIDTTANQTDSLNKRFVTDALLTILGNTSNTNSGNETATSIGALINAAGAATPNDTDFVATAESGGLLKKITWTNAKAFLKTWLDSLTTTFTNKRITPRVTTIVSSATPTPDSDASDVFTVTALGAAAVFAAPTGTPTEGQPLVLRIKDDGTARAISFNAIYRAVGVTMPTTTVLGKVLYIALLYNSVTPKWDVVAVCQEA